MLSAIVGINWGDEGKGRMVDLLSQDYDVVVRYQGGNNAGHTVINHLGKFILNLMPSGILRPEVVNVMGNGMVIDLEHLHKEMGKLVQAGLTTWCRTAWRRTGWQTQNTALPAEALLRYTVINI